MVNILSGIELSNDIFPAQLIVSLIIMGILLILCFVIFFKCKKADPLKAPKGILFWTELLVEYIDNTIDTNAGPQFRNIFGGIFGFLVPYLFLSMTCGLFGVQTPISYLFITVIFGITTFLLIHIVSAYYTKWKYFKRYIDPFPFFLPINLLSMWAPLLSITFRLFGNAIAGYCLTRLVYAAFSSFGVGPLAMIITPPLHMYFDLFSGAIQTFVFFLLTLSLVKNEIPDEISMKYDKQLQEERALEAELQARIDSEAELMQIKEK